MTERGPEPEEGGEEGGLVLGGRYVFAADDGFRVVFLPANRGLPLALFGLASLAIVVFTLRLLLQEPSFNLLAWGIAGVVDFALILALHIVRRHLDRGRLIVDAAERRVLLGGGAEIDFDRLRGLRLLRTGAEAELVLDYEEGLVRFGARPAEEAERAAAAVARLTGLPLASFAGVGAG